jgi:AraC-like DNA-binding protein
MESAELVNTLLLLGTGQGLLLAAVLATKQTNSTANRILAVAMLVFSVSIFARVYYAREYYDDIPHFIGVSVPLVFVFGPILYLYAQAVSTGGRSFRKASLLHFIPFLLVTLRLLPFYLLDGPAKLAFLEDMFRNGPPRYLAIIEHLQYPHGIVYVFLTIGVLRSHQARMRQTHSSIERINLRWLRTLTIAIAAIWALATGLHLVHLAGIGVPMEPNLTPLAVSIFVYAVGYLGLRQPEIFELPIRRDEPSRKTPIPAPAGTSLADVQGAGPDAAAGYEKSGLTPAQAGAAMRQLLRVMEEKKPYRRSLLTLQELADEMAISAHNLSEVINTQAGKNFYDFVNRYRVEEVMRRLQDPRSDHLTLLAIAAESGFNSKSTFNAFFRKTTGLTPSQYRASHAATTSAAPPPVKLG